MGSVCLTPRLEHSCGSSDGLQLFRNDDDTITGYCFACDTHVPNPLGEARSYDDIKEKYKLSKTPEEVATELAEIKTLKAMHLPDRKLKSEDLEAFGVKVGLSESDGKTPNTIYFPYYGLGKKKVVGYNVKLIEPKRFWGIGDRKEVELFGWKLARQSGSSRIYVTEGELDAIALYKIFKRYQGKGYTIPAVVSLPHGAASAAKDLKKVRRKLDKFFKEVYFVFDDDKAGQLALDKATAMFPDAKEVILPAKDVNQALIEGKGKEVFQAAYWEASKPKNSRLVYGYDIHNEAKEPAEFGVSWPWQYLTDVTRGIRTGETIYIAGPEKMGKSELVNAIAAWLISEHGWRVLLAKPEEANKKSYKMLLSKVVGKVFHDPNIDFDEDAYERAGDIAKNHVIMLDLYQHIDFESLVKDIRYAADEGVKAVFIDPITNLTNGLSSSDINTTLQGITQDLAALAKDLDVVIFVFAHINKAPKGKDWNKGDVASTNDFAGSSAMARSCNYAFVLSGNKDPDIPERERNMRKLHLLADREFGCVGVLKLIWEKTTHLFRQIN